MLAGDAEGARALWRRHVLLMPRILQVREVVFVWIQLELKTMIFSSVSDPDPLQETLI